MIAKSIITTGFWYMTFGDRLFEVWAWEDQEVPPTTLHERGYRFVHVAQVQR